MADLTGDLTIDLTEDDGSHPTQSQVNDINGLAACLSDKQCRALVLELAHNPATAVLTQYRLWAASLGWMAPGSRGLAVAPKMITRMGPSQSIPGGLRLQNGRRPRPIRAGSEKKPSHARKAVKPGRGKECFSMQMQDGTMIANTDQ